MGQMQLEKALQIVDHVVSAAPGPVSVFVADDHGEVMAAATMDGAAPDTRLNAERDLLRLQLTICLKNLFYLLPLRNLNNPNFENWLILASLQLPSTTEFLTN